MLTRDVVDWVRELLDAGYSARAVALLTGASRGSVNLIRDGKRTDQFGSDPGESSGPSLWSEVAGYRVERCRCCGARAYIRPTDGGACLACRVRRSVAAA
jgi:hypothetical protein